MSPPSRSQAEAARRLWRSFPTAIKLYAVAAAIVLVGGLGWATFGAHEPNRLPPLLGRIDPPPVSRPGPPAPPFRMPWWR